MTSRKLTKRIVKVGMVCNNPKSLIPSQRILANYPLLCWLTSYVINALQLIGIQNLPWHIGDYWNSGVELPLYWKICHSWVSSYFWYGSLKICLAHGSVGELDMNWWAQNSKSSIYPLSMKYKFLQIIFLIKPRHCSLYFISFLEQAWLLGQHVTCKWHDYWGITRRPTDDA